MKFIHTADLHLDAPVSGLRERAKVRREALGALEQMIAYGTRQNIKYMVIAGDLFDTPAPSAATLGAVKTMLEQAPMTFIIAAGNHDVLRQGRYCGTDWPDNVVIFGAQMQCVAVPEGSFVGASFSEEMRAHPLASTEWPAGWRVAVLHGSLGDSNPLHRIDEATLTALQADYVALGHIHKGEDPHRAAGTWVGNGGSPAPHGFDEAGVRSFLELELDEGGLHWQRINIDGVRFWEETVEIDESEDHSAILGRLMVSAARYGEKDIFRFRLRGKTLCSLPSALEEYPNLAEIIDETTLPFSLEQEAGEQTLRGYFVREMLERMRRSTPEERKKYEAALRLGLEAFE